MSCDCDILDRALKRAHREGAWDQEDYDAMYNAVQNVKNYCFYHHRKGRVEFGTDTGISFLTRDGVKKMEPGKLYDENVNEIKNPSDLGFI